MHEAALSINIRLNLNMGSHWQTLISFFNLKFLAVNGKKVLNLSGGKYAFIKLIHA